MKIGFLGLGKLGLPCALAMESKGHTVCGYDINPHVLEDIRNKKLKYACIISIVWASHYIIFFNF